MGREYYVYIMTNASNDVLYVGLTNDISRRAWEHKSHVKRGFTALYNVNKCVYVEIAQNANDAIAREKQIKSWSRKRKFDLINTMNPEMKDLFE